MLGLFRKKTLIESGIFSGLHDIHSHILPGVDDGIKTMEHSLDTLALLENAGVKKVTLTPHIMEDVPNTTEKLKSVFEELKLCYRGKIELNLGAEYMMDSLLEERLEAGDILTVSDEGHILMETSTITPAIQLEDMLDLARLKGYIPILAHPERYQYADLDRLREIHEKDIELQLNIPSLAGIYGKAVKKRAEDILAAGLYTRLGNDIHSFRRFSSIMELPISRKAAKLLEKVK